MSANDTNPSANDGRKSKLKKLETKPSGTKEKKLPKPLLSELEDQFGIKLNRVRVHTGGNIAEIAKELKAKVFVIDQNIYCVKPGDAKNPEVLKNHLTQAINLFKDKLKKKTKDGRAIVGKK